MNNCPFLTRAVRILSLVVSLLFAASAFATANYVYHERSANNVYGTDPTDCSGAKPYVPVLVPVPGTTHVLRYKVEYQGYVNTGWVYYTTNGATPSGANGVGGNSTFAVTASFDCKFDPFNDNVNWVDIWIATIPGMPSGTTVKYIIGAKHTEGGDEVFANNNNGCTSSSCATVFQYTVQDTNPTWDGGGSPDGNWSNGANWMLNGRPTSTGATLTFAGTIGLLNANDCVTALATSGTALTFASGAGSFVLSGNAITMGSGGGGGQTIISQQSANNQEIVFNINLSGGNGDRTIVFGSGAGSLTLSGSIYFNNDWLFPNTTAGTIILSGNNTGEGKATAAITAGSNTMRAMMRNNVAGTILTLGSDTCLGNSGSGSVSAGTAALRGVLANQNMTINTTGGNRNLSGSTLAINAGNITFNGANNLIIGNLISQGGNRDFLVSSSGQVTVQDSLSLSADQTGRNLYLNLSGSGGMVVNGKIYDTFHSGGLTTGFSTLRKANTGMLTLNGNSTYTGLTTVEGGTLRIGHANALGAGGSTSGTTLAGASTLDLNGFTIGESITNTSSGNTLANSSASASGLTQDMTLFGDLTVNAAGDISVTRLIGNATRTVTKNGAGAITTSGTSHNNLTAWTINNGTVVFANSSGYGADRSVTLAGGTLRLSGANSDLINNGESFTINSGVFDLNGKAEAVASIGGTGGFVRNTSASTTTLYVGGGISGASSASYAGVIENGTGTLNLTKEGSGTQTLTGANTYTGNTIISAGTLALSGSGSIANSPLITVASGATFDVSGLSATFALASGRTLANGGAGIANLVGNVNAGSGTVALSFAAGTPSFATSGTLTLAGATVFTVNNTGAALAHGSYKLIAKSGAGSVAGNLPSVTVTGGGASGPASLRLVSGELYLDINNPPVAHDLTLGVTQGDSVTFLVIGGKHAPSDADTDPLTVTAVTTPSQGSASFNASSVTYNATGNAGTFTFDYTVSDGYGGTGTATVTVVVSAAANGANLIASTLSVTGAHVSCTAMGLPEASYRLQFSDMNGAVNWQDLTGSDQTAATNGVMNFDYTNATDFPSSGYFRTMHVSGP